MGGPGVVVHDPDGITSYQRGGVISCTDVANDPRVSGQLVGTWDAVGWDPEQSRIPQSFIEWGTLRLENEAGAWEGTFSGVFTKETGDLLTVWFVGSGDYAGLSYFQFLEAPPLQLLTGVEYHGFIFPGPPPPRPEPPAAPSESP